MEVENQGMGQMWDDKQKKVWYNSIIKKGEGRKPVARQRVFAFFVQKGGVRLQRELSGERILQELCAIAFARVTDYLQVENGALATQDSSRLTKQQAAAIASMEKTSTGVKVKFYDKLKALELLGKAMGLFEGLAAEQERNNLLEAILLATEKEVDTGDLPEVQQAAAAGHELVEQAETAGI